MEFHSSTFVLLICLVLLSSNVLHRTIWTDIDYMDGYRDFTWDPVKFNQDDMKKFADQLHDDGQHYVVIVDPGIKVEDGYEPFEQGLEMDVFIKDQQGKPFVGKVWPGFTAFPDFLHPNTSDYWSSMFAKFLNEVPIDGIWIDMNEASNM